MEVDDHREDVPEDLSLGEEEGSSGSQNPTVRKAINLKLKPQKSKEKRETKSQDPPITPCSIKNSPLKEMDVSTNRLSWDHKVELFGEKVIDPLIHCCEQCLLPILIYGRMIPCKHVYCLDCARKTSGVCLRCGDAVQRIEECALGTVFLCTYGGAKHGVSGCRRTYLSHRDLQAHVTHRHLKGQQLLPPPPPPPIALQPPVPQLHLFNQAAVAAVSSAGLENRTLPQPRIPSAAPPFHPVHHRVNLSQPPPSGGTGGQLRSEPRETFSIPLVRTSSNLITIPIQDDIEFSNGNSSSSSGSTFPQHHYGQSGNHATGIAPYGSPSAVPYPGSVGGGGQTLHATMLTMHHGLPPPPQPHLGQPGAGVQPPIAAAHQPQGTYVPVPTQVTSQWGRQPPQQQQHGMQPYY